MKRKGKKGKHKFLKVLSTAFLSSQLLFSGSGYAINSLPALSMDSNGEVLEMHNHTEESLFDVRKKLEKIMPDSEQIAATDHLIENLGAGIKVKWNYTFGTPSMIYRDGGYLTEKASGSAEDIARNWLKQHAATFGLSVADINELKVARNYSLPGSGLQPVTFQQTIDGIESVYGGRIIVAVNKEGRILSVTSNASKADQLTANFELTSSEALMKVVGLHNTGINYAPKSLGVENGWEAFDGQSIFPTVQRVKKAVFLEANEVRPAYRVLYIEELDKGYEVVVDAATGEKLYERSLVDHIGDDPEGLIFENYPGSPQGGYQIVKSFAGDANASPIGWITPTAEGSMTTLGNNADTYANWSNFLVPEGAGVVRPVAALGKFKYTFKDAWAKSNGEIPSYAEDVHSATTNLFYHHNLFHDYFYNLGWTEAAGNLQAVNFGRGGLQGDPILGLVQAGAVSGSEPTYTGRDNAYMLTLPDGVASWSGMFLWEPIQGAFHGAYADGDFDAGIIYHEYAHALTNRLVAGGEALGSHQAGSMGEGWGDWYGMHYLIKNGLQEEPVVGAYVTNNDERGIRNYSLADAPYNFGDVGYDIIGPEVHADGDIWAAILWHVRTAMLDTYGKEYGERVIEQLVMDAMPISVPDPSFDDMRTAIIQADVDRYGGAHYDTLWKAFAQRGLGESAYSLTGDDTNPVTAFDHPNEALNGTLVGKLINKDTKKPIEGARIIIGQYEARTSAASVTDNKGKFGLKLVEGTYDITIQAPGFGSRTYHDVQVTAGKKLKFKLPVSPNMASLASGASVMSPSNDETESNPLKNVIDDTEASVYASSKQEGGFTGTEFIVDLAGDEPVTVSYINVSAFKDISKSRFATLKDFEIQASVDGETWNTVVDDTFTYALPRPATPDLHYKGWDIAPVKAKYLKFIAKSAQENSKGYIQVAEVQVFSHKDENINPGQLPSLPDFEATGTIQGSNAANGIGQLAGVAASGGVTENEFVASQNPNPVTQGVDGYVVTLPSNDEGKYNYGGYNVSVVGEENVLGHDIDLYFYDKDFKLIGSIATSGANESGVMPGGTRYVFVALYTGANMNFTLKAVSPY